MSEAEQLPTAEAIDPFLEAYLEPFRSWLAQPDVTEILVNRPGEVWVEQRGRMTRHKAAKIDDALLQRLAEQVARVSNQGVTRERPLLAAMLPNGARVQFVLAEAAAHPFAETGQSGFQTRHIGRVLAKGMLVADGLGPLVLADFGIVPATGVQAEQATRLSL